MVAEYLITLLILQPIFQHALNLYHILQQLQKLHIGVTIDNPIKPN